MVDDCCRTFPLDHVGNVGRFARVRGPSTGTGIHFDNEDTNQNGSGLFSQASNGPGLLVCMTWMPCPRIIRFVPCHRFVVTFLNFL